MLNKIDYKTLNARQKELYNFHKISAALVGCGYQCVRLTDDWMGADFLAINMLKYCDAISVQLKSNFCIDKKYCNKNIWIAFPDGADWFLIKHDDLVDIVGSTTVYLLSDSWKIHGKYRSNRLSSELRRAITEYIVPK